MCCTAQYARTAGRRRKNRPAVRILAFIFCIAYIAFALTGTALLAAHVNHVHDHSGPDGSCAACAHMAAVGNMLKQLLPASLGAAAVFACLLTALFFFRPAFLPICSYSPVALKVKLNN